MNRRTLTIVVGILLTLSLIGVGFASWVITAGETENYSGAIQVQEVTDERVYIDGVKFFKDGAEIDVANANFVFGAPVTPAEGATNQWLVNGEKEVLTFKVQFTVKKKVDNSVVTDASVSAVFGLDEDTSFAVADETDKTYAAIAKANPTITHKGEGVYEFEISLTWGNYWGAGVNPFDYYNSKVLTDTLAQEANTKLGAMYAALQNAGYVLTITANPAA